MCGIFGCIVGVLTCGCAGGTCFFGKIDKNDASRRETLARRRYAALFLLVVAVAWGVSRFGVELAGWIPGLDACDAVVDTGALADTDSLCYGWLSVLRLGFALFLFFGTQAIVFYIGRESATVTGYHLDAWPLKLLALAALIGVSFLIPANELRGFAWLALFGAAVFLLVQAWLLQGAVIAFQQRVKRSVERSTSGSTPLKVMWVVITVLAFLGLLATLFVMFWLFGYDVGCSVLSPLLIVLQLFLSLGVVALSLVPSVAYANPNNGVMSAVLISAYCVWVLYGALAAQPGECARNEAEGSVPIGSLLLAILFSFLSLARLVTSTGKKIADVVVVEGSDDPDAIENIYVDTPLRLVDDMPGGNDPERPVLIEGYKTNVGVIPGAYLFHGVMALGSLYVVMVLTGYRVVGVATEGDVAVLDINRGWPAVWGKWAASLISMLFLYVSILYPWVQQRRMINAAPYHPA